MNTAFQAAAWVHSSPAFVDASIHNAREFIKCVNAFRHPIRELNSWQQEVKLIESVANGLSFLGIGGLDFRVISDAVARLEYALAAVPRRLPSAKSGSRPVEFAKVFAGVLGSEFERAFGLKLPKSRDRNWFSDIVHSAWEDLELPTRWSQKDIEFSGWIAARTFEGLNEGFRLEVTESELRITTNKNRTDLT